MHHVIFHGLIEMTDETNALQQILYIKIFLLVCSVNSSYVIFALYLPPCETSSFFHGDENFKVVYQNEFIFKKYKLI